VDKEFADEANASWVRGARCCGSGLGDCDLARLARVFPVRRCMADACGGRWGRLASTERQFSVILFR